MCFGMLVVDEESLASNVKLHIYIYNINLSSFGDLHEIHVDIFANAAVVVDTGLNGLTSKLLIIYRVTAPTGFLEI